MAGLRVGRRSLALTSRSVTRPGESIRLIKAAESDCPAGLPWASAVSTWSWNDSPSR